MALALFILFIVVPIGELSLLLWIADVTHWAFPLALVITTGVLGATLLRVQGVLTARRIFAGSGEPPTDPLIDAGLMLLAAGMLITPGVVTDLLGLSFLFPLTRLLWRNRVKRWAKARFQVVTFSEMPPGRNSVDDVDDLDDDNVIEGEVVE